MAGQALLRTTHHNVCLGTQPDAAAANTSRTADKVYGKDTRTDLDGANM